jgi:hypothetical protein
MRQFKDEKGRPWTISVNVGTVKKVRGLAGIDLLDVQSGSMFQQLAEDPVKLGDVLWVLCQEEAEERKVGELDFAAALAGDSLSSATEALLEEVTDFFPKPQRELLRKALSRAKASQERSMAKASEMVDKALDEWEAANSGGLSTSVQESSE